MEKLEIMDIKNTILSKSNSYNFYKEKYEEYKNKYEEYKEKYELVLEENSKLKNDYKYSSNIRPSEYQASTFCDWRFHDYSFREDFPFKLQEFLNNFPEDSRKRAIQLFLRANGVYLLNKDTLFTDEELKLQDEYLEFSNKNVSGNEICGFKFTDQNYNKHCFMNDFMPEDMNYIGNKDIIDAGAYIGDSSLAFSRLTSSKVHAFEPFSESFNKLLENIKLNDVDNIVPVEASLSDKNGEEKIYLSGNNVQGITSDESFRHYDKSFTVKTMTIDKYVQENNLNVGFIKVDVEGTEQKLLKGAIETIKSQKPFLILSIYHNPSDFYEIKPWIEKLDLGYNFKISKERPWTFLADTVLECRPY